MLLPAPGGWGGFTTEEHPIPESIGNHELILPRGVVCDRCNLGPLSVLDQRLADFFPAKMRRTTVGVVSTCGGSLSTRAGGVSTGVGMVFT